MPGVGVFDWGWVENSAEFPPTTDATVMTVGSYVRVIPYAPRTVEGPTSIVTSAVNCCPDCTVAGQLIVACAA